MMNVKNHVLQGARNDISLLQHNPSPPSAGVIIRGGVALLMDGARTILEETGGKVW